MRECVSSFFKSSFSIPFLSLPSQFLSPSQLSPFPFCPPLVLITSLSYYASEVFTSFTVPSLSLSIIPFSFLTLRPSFSPTLSLSYPLLTLSFLYLPISLFLSNLIPFPYHLLHRHPSLSPIHTLLHANWILLTEVIKTLDYSALKFVPTSNRSSHVPVRDKSLDKMLERFQKIGYKQPSPRHF